jgi:hypothetical protein
MYICARIICNYVERTPRLYRSRQGKEAAMMASAPEVHPAFVPAHASAGGQAGSAAGGVRLLLRLEGAAVFAAALAIYAHSGFSWLLFAALFLAPDLTMLSYFAGPRVGAAAYNAAHIYVLPLALLVLGFIAGAAAAAACALIWIAHIGIDRALGYGVKYPTGFGDTHLGRIGRR